MFTSLFYFCIESLFVFPCQWNYRPDHCIYGSNCQEAEEEGIFILHGNRGVYHDDKQPAFRAIYEALRNVSSFFLKVFCGHTPWFTENLHILYSRSSVINPTTPSPYSSGTWPSAVRKGTAFCPLTDLCIISMSSLILFFSANYNAVFNFIYIDAEVVPNLVIGVPLLAISCAYLTHSHHYFEYLLKEEVSKISQAYLIMPSLPLP